MKLLTVAVAVALLAPCAARAQEDAVANPANPRVWGTRYSSVSVTNAWTFVGPLTDAGNGYRRCNPATDACRAALELEGATMAWSLGLEACDTSPTTEAVARLWACEEAPGACAIVGEVHTGIADTPGCTQVWENLPYPYLSVRNWHNTYHVDVLGAGASGNAPADFRAVRIAYVRQLGPAPATATFSDVPTTHPYFRHIEKLAEALIVGGCGNGQFCPDRAMTRGELAVVLAEALGMNFLE